MTHYSMSLEFFMQLAKINAYMTRRFDGKLGVHHGVGFTDFIILAYLNYAPDGRVRRVDLVEELGLTASGITRLLLPMEKIGLVKRQTDPRDARVSYVTLAPGGRRLFKDALDTAETLSQESISPLEAEKFKDLFKVFSRLSS